MTSNEEPEIHSPELEPLGLVREGLGGSIFRRTGVVCRLHLLEQIQSFKPKLCERWAYREIGEDQRGSSHDARLVSDGMGRMQWMRWSANRKVEKGFEGESPPPWLYFYCIKPPEPRLARVFPSLGARQISESQG